MMPDTTFVQDVVSNMIRNRIIILSDSGTQLDDTLLQIRLATLAIVVGVALLGPRIKKGKKLRANVLFFFILLMPFTYDMYSRDQQVRRQRKVQSLEMLLPTIADSSYAWQKSFRFKYGDSLSSVGPQGRWCHRLHNVKNDLWFWGWYTGCFLIGLALLHGIRNYTMPPILPQREEKAKPTRLENLVDAVIKYLKAKSQNKRP